MISQLDSKSDDFVINGNLEVMVWSFQGLTLANDTLVYSPAVSKKVAYGAKEIQKTERGCSMSLRSDKCLYILSVELKHQVDGIYCPNILM